MVMGIVSCDVEGKVDVKDFFMVKVAGVMIVIMIVERKLFCYGGDSDGDEDNGENGNDNYFGMEVMMIMKRVVTENHFLWR